MADVGGAAPRGHDKKKKKHKKMRRLGIRLDMTPMVDVAFLLLTFFYVDHDNEPSSNDGN